MNEVLEVVLVLLLSMGIIECSIRILCILVEEEKGNQ